MDIKDNYLTVEQYKYVWNLARTAKYDYKEQDNVMVAQLDETALSFFPEDINGEKLDSSQINCYVPRATTVFHVDTTGEEAITMIYYLNPTYELDEGGCTELFVDDEIVGIRPINNRAFVFNSNILHRGVTYKSHTRFTIGLRYTNLHNSDWLIDRK